MESITLETIYKHLVDLRKEMTEVKIILENDKLNLADDVVEEIEESRRRTPKEFVSHKEMINEFG